MKAAVQSATAVSTKTQEAITAKVAKELEYKVTPESNQEHRYFTDEAFFERYDLTPQDLLDLQDYSHNTVGEHQAPPVVGKILNKDYGLNAKTPGVQ